MKNYFTLLILCITVSFLKNDVAFSMKRVIEDETYTNKQEKIFKIEESHAEKKYVYGIFQHKNKDAKPKIDASNSPMNSFPKKRNRMQ